MWQTVRACEKTGALPEALSRYVAYNRNDAVKRQVSSPRSIRSCCRSRRSGDPVSDGVRVRFSHIYADIGVTAADVTAG